MTSATARQFDLHVGSKVQLTGAGSAGRLILEVSGIVVPSRPGHPPLDRRRGPRRSCLRWKTRTSISPPPIWVGGVIAGPAEADAVQTNFGTQAGLAMQSVPPRYSPRLGHRAAGAAAQRHADLAQRPDAAAVGRRRPGGRPRAEGVSSPGLLPTLAAYFTTAQAVDALLWLLWVSLTVTGVDGAAAHRPDGGDTQVSGVRGGSGRGARRSGSWRLTAGRTAASRSAFPRP